MTKQSQIRWQRGDYVKLGRAVSEFNKKVQRLEANEESLGLPELIDYKDLKSQITTRKELNRQIASLKRFKEEGIEKLTDLTEDSMSLWEYQELEKGAKSAIRQLKKDLQKYETPNEQGISRVQMGSTEASTLKQNIQRLQNWRKFTGRDLENIKWRIKYYGASDYTMKRAIVYRENYLKEMEKYRGFERYDELMEYLYSIKNPIDFYDRINDKSELASDLFYQSNQKYSEDRFSAFVDEVKGI